MESSPGWCYSLAGIIGAGTVHETLRSANQGQSRSHYRSVMWGTGLLPEANLVSYSG
jgi:hypothetical protein